MILSDVSIKNPVFAWMLMIGIVVFGGIAFTLLGVSQLPDVDIPVVSISCSWENAAPEVMETEVTDAIEDSILGIEGVEEVTSSSRKGGSRVSIAFDINKNIDTAMQEVQGRLSRLQRSFPRDMDPPVISKSNPEDQPILWISLSGDNSLKYLMEYTQDYLKDQFSMVPGVAEVSMGGFTSPSLRVWLDTEKMKNYELTVDDIISAIQTEHTETPAGFIDTGRQEMNIRVLGEAGSVKEFSSIIIPSRKGSSLWKKFKISDVAEVEDGLDNIRDISRTMGQTAVGIGIKKQRGTNSVEVAKAVKKKLKELQQYLPEGVKLETRFDMTSFVEDSIKEMYFVMILSVILTSLVCWLFLGSFSSAFNVFLTIPMSICGTLFVLYVLGFTLNMFTLLGLSLVIGIIVDDAIMMLENIARHRENGESKVKAAIKGAREITFAAISATTAILAIFVPVIFMKGIIGKYFLQFGITISVAVMISLLGALTLTPMFCAQFLTIGHTTRFGKGMDNFMHGLKEIYSYMLDICLRNRWKVILGSSILFVSSLFLFGVLKKEFTPPQDQGRLMVRVETKTGSSIEFTDSIMKEIENILRKRPEVDTYFSRIDSHSGFMMLTLKPFKQRPKDKEKKHRLSQQELIPSLRKDLKGIRGIERIVVSDPSLMSFGGRRGTPVSFSLNGPDWNKLSQLSMQMGEEMEKTGLMTDIDTDFEVGAPEVRVLPDRQKAAERSVSISAIGATINSLIGGVRVGKYTKGGRRYDVRVQLVSGDRKNESDITKIWVRNSRGEVIKLSDVVSVDKKPSLLTITRRNRERAIRVSANVALGKSQGEAMAAVEVIAKKILPEGYKMVYSGGSQTFKESFNGLYLALILGIFVAYMVLGTQFNSFVHPFTVLIALPFSISGAILAMLITGQSFNIYSAIGVILLMGIVKKNSILLVDFTNQRREEGLNVDEALKNACPVRLRPILMTSFATIAAAVPPALAMGPGAETRVPMAVVVIGGVFVSTLLTLFVVPCVYSLLSIFESKKHQKDVHDALKELQKI
ncbi:MAG: hypothetical protein A2252_12230 [Elusimicrobia bacterium RIFOXYA2_FULL_39_19]|nr:MAG: hypothetical protein A2252_12230 [Elusimicrobia bacterium RIFOXYA2_FULL_39_19]